MKVNFLSDECVTTTSARYFGICDDDDKRPAYLHFSPGDGLCIAKVTNTSQIPVIFRAIDNCIDVLRDSGDMESRCDVLLECEQNLIFIELKNKLGRWKAEGIDQLEKTLQLIIDSHPEYYSSFKKKRAFVANRKHPNFQEVENETMARFYKKYKVRLEISADIKIN